MGSSQRRVKPKTIKLVFIASLLSKDWLAQKQNNVSEWSDVCLAVFYQNKHSTGTVDIVFLRLTCGRGVGTRWISCRLRHHRKWHKTISKKQNKDVFIWSRTHQSDDQQWNKVGFVWSWNFMLLKKWRTSHTGDEAFQDRILADFRAFCSNKDDYESKTIKKNFLLYSLSFHSFL
jgi:hypothetical protein